MNKINELYRNIIMNGFYDEEHSLKSEIIDGKKHGICLHFSQELIEKLRSNGYLAGLISTLNEDGYLHAAVLYKDLETGVVSIADPVTDVRKLTGLTDEQRKEAIDQILETENWKRKIEEYIKEYGTITAYNHDMSIAMKEIKDREETEAVPSINVEISKKVESIQKLTSLADVKKVADGPTLLACQTLYKKGISTYCSNYTPNGDVSINVHYNSLSEENKAIVLKLREEHSEHYFIKNRTGFYGSLGHNDEIAENKLMELVFGIKESKGKLTPQINLEMNQFISILKKQPYLQGGYTREEVLNNRHNLSVMTNLTGNNEETCKSSEADSNKQIAINEGLLYSEKYDRFFEDYVAKSRYIESLCRHEHDLRTEDEMAQESGLFYDKKEKMFFETEREAELYRRTFITTADIVEADIDRKIPESITDRIKKFFSNVIEKLKGIGER